MDIILNLKSLPYNTRKRNNKNHLFATNFMSNKTNLGYSNICFKGNNNNTFELYFSEKELEDRISTEKFTPYKMLDANAIEYQQLSSRDKSVLKHLVKASNAFENVYKKMDNHYNLDFEKYLENEIKKGNKRASMTKKLYDAQRGIFANDINGTPISLVKNLEQKICRGFYPQDLKIEEFHKILIKMLNENKDKEVRKILNQRSIVVRDGEYLKAIDYTEAFKKEFSIAIKELIKAAKITKDKKFKEYLLLQAKALSKNNKWIDCIADKKWAELQNSTLEFTISREAYDDEMTPSVTSNGKLKAMLDEKGIIPYAKDSFGTRVGIIDKNGTDYLLKIKKHLPFLASKMPYNNQYNQIIADISQTMVDTDIVHVSGDLACYRGGIGLASILPNDNKLAILTGGGRRTVHMKQMRNSKFIDSLNKRLNALLNKDFHKYFSAEALHDFIILHENIHALGPKNNLENLGPYKSIIEENKADMGALSMLEELKKIAFYSEQKQKEIITSYILSYVPAGPDFSNAHSTMTIMQYNHFIKNKAITFDTEGKIKIDFEQITKSAREMLEKIIKIQLSANPQIAKKYIDSYSIFPNELQSLSNKLKLASIRLNSYVIQPLAKKLLKMI